MWLCGEGVVPNPLFGQPPGLGAVSGRQGCLPGPPASAMFRRARLSVKPNVRPSVGARGSTAPNPQRGQESPRPPEPATDSASKPAEPTDVPAVDFGGAEPQEKAPRSR